MQPHTGDKYKTSESQSSFFKGKPCQLSALQTLESLLSKALAELPLKIYSRDVTSQLSYLKATRFLPHHVPSQAGCTLQWQGLGTRGCRGEERLGMPSAGHRWYQPAPAGPPQGAADSLCQAGAASGKRV